MDPGHGLIGRPKVAKKTFDLKELDDGKDTCSVERQLECLKVLKVTNWRHVVLTPAFILLLTLC